MPAWDHQGSAECHALYDEIVNPAESDEEKGTDPEDGSDDDETDEESLKERLRRSEASLRILAECSRSNEKRRREPQSKCSIATAHTSSASRHAPYSPGQFNKSSQPGVYMTTQNTLLDGDKAGVGPGINVLCTILQRMHAEVSVIVSERETKLMNDKQKNSIAAQLDEQRRQFQSK